MPPPPDGHVALRAVAFRGGDVWVVQGLEYDIAAFTSDPSQAPDAFMRAVVENACICEQLGHEPFHGLKPAPQHFAEMWSQARSTLRSLNPDTSGREIEIRLIAA